jgi:hypothetical protein
LSIEKEDACDEPNEHESNGRIPISNSCGTLGYSYQDMTCPDNSRNMACPVDEDMELTAVTFGRQIGSAPPLTCAPRSRIKFTGYWDTELVREEKSEAYANDNGRVDVSGGCHDHSLFHCPFYALFILINATSCSIHGCIHQGAVGGEEEYYKQKEYVTLDGSMLILVLEPKV